MTKSLEDADVIQWYVDQCVALWDLGSGKARNREDRNPYWFKEFQGKENPWKSDSVKPLKTQDDNFSEWFVRVAGTNLLKRCNIIETNYSPHPRNVHLDGIIGHFLPYEWCIKMIETKVTDIMVYESFRLIVALTYHECRHAEQFFRIAQCLSTEMATKEKWKSSPWRKHFKTPFASNRHIKTPNVKACLKCKRIFEPTTKICDQCKSELPGSTYYFTKQWADYESYKGIKNKPKKTERTAGEIAELIAAATRMHLDVAKYGVTIREYLPASLKKDDRGKVFGWYDSFMGESSIPRALILDEIKKDNAAVWKSYQNLPEESDAFALQALILEALDKKIPDA